MCLKLFDEQAIKMCSKWSDATFRGVWSWATHFNTHEASFWSTLFGWDCVRIFSVDTVPYDRALSELTDTINGLAELYCKIEQQISYFF